MAVPGGGRGVAVGEDTRARRAPLPAARGAGYVARTPIRSAPPPGTRPHTLAGAPP